MDHEKTVVPDRDNKSLLILLTHMHNAFRYRLYPTRKQETVPNQQLEECRWLYKRFLEYRKNVREWYGISSYSGQKNTLPALKKGTVISRYGLSPVQKNRDYNVSLTILRLGLESRGSPQKAHATTVSQVWQWCGHGTIFSEE
ncbi:MAG: helix-turn-helix domain-containing protein [Leptospirillum sp.]